MPAATARPFYPIIYLRGFAATMNEIEATTADPYMGFNLGSAMIRQDSEGVAHPFIFESPLLRLIKDHGYIDAFQNGGIDYADKLAPARSIWIYRYYESVSKSLGSSTRRIVCQRSAPRLAAVPFNEWKAMRNSSASPARMRSRAVVKRSTSSIVL